MLANHRTSNFPKNDWEYEGWRVFQRATFEVTGCSGRHGQEKRGWSTLWLYGDPRDIHCYSRSYAERRVSQ